MGLGVTQSIGLGSAMWLLVLVLLSNCIQSAISTTCSYQLIQSSDRGYINSPNYPLAYPANICIIWVYRGHPGIHIRIDIIHMDIITDHDYCDNDHLMIGPVNQQTYCGSNKTPYQADMTSVDSVLYILFNSSSTGTKGTGFRLYYDISETLGVNYEAVVNSTILHEPISTTTTRPPEQPAQTLPREEGTCSYVLTDLFGEITMNKTIAEALQKAGSCSWLVYDPTVGPSNVTYELMFGSCRILYRDTLSVYDGPDWQMERGAYTGQHCPRVLISSGNGFLIKYTPHDVTFLSDFDIFYRRMNNIDGGEKGKMPSVSTSIPTKTPPYDPPTILPSTPTMSPVLEEKHSQPELCRFVVTDTSGQITNSPSVYRAILDSYRCMWLLHVPLKYGDVVNYQLTCDPCQLFPGDTLRLYDGADSRAPLLRDFSYLGSPAFREVVSTGSAVFIEYQSTEYFLEKRIPANFTIKFTIKLNCAAGLEICGYGELGCFRSSDRCDGIWNCPLHGGDERGCSAHCPADEFSCGGNSHYCYREADRCNGKGTCANYMDEMGCTANSCSPENGLYLCGNGRCIYQKWKCDRTVDCADNSDEDDCSSFSSPRVIIAAVVGSLMCSLLLVIALGCVCKVYSMRLHQMRGGPRHETPLSRQLAEMFHHRAPPPPYHEAMLTSRPYSEAYSQLLSHAEDGQAENTSSAAISSDQQGGSSSVLGGGARSQHRRHGHRRCRHGRRHRNICQGSSRHRSETAGYINIGTLSLLAEVLESGAYPQEGLGSDGVGSTAFSDPPPYSESDPSAHQASALMEESSSNSDDNSSEEDNWQSGFGNADGQGEDDSHASLDGESLIQMELIPTSLHRTGDLSTASSNSQRRSSAENRALQCRGGFSDENEDDDDDDDNENDEDDKVTDVASTSLSLSSTNDRAQVIAEEDGEKVEGECVSVIEEDSDSECILAEEGDGDNVENDSDSDTVCLLSRA